MLKKKLSILGRKTQDKFKVDLLFGMHELSCTSKNEITTK